MVFVLDKNKKLVTTITEYEVSISSTGTLSDTLTYFEFTGEMEGMLKNTLEMVVQGNHADSPLVCSGNYLVFKDYDLKWQMYEIKQEDDIHENGEILKRVYAEHAYYELLDDVITDLGVVDNSATMAMQKALTGSDWELKTVEPTTTGTVSFYYISRLEALQKVVEKFGGVLAFEVEFANGVISHKYVSLLNRLGKETGKQFSYDKDITRIRRTTDSYNIITACYGRGKGVEVGETSDGNTTYGRRLDLSDAVWTTPTNPVNKPLGQLYLENPTALANWGRDGGTKHKFGVYVDDEETDINALMEKTWAYLQEHSVPKVTYEMDVITLERLSGYEHEAVRMGDTIVAIDSGFSPPLKIQADIIKIKRDYLNPENDQITCGNYRKTFYDENMDISQKVDRLTGKEGAYDIAGQVTDGGVVKTSVLEGTIETLQNMINAGGGSVTITDDNGIMIVDNPANPTNAMKLTSGGFSIANTKLPSGEWEWRTFGTGEGFTADLITVGTINAGLIKTGVINAGNGISWIDMNTGFFKLGGMEFDANGFKITLSGGNTLESAINKAQTDANTANTNLNDMKNYLNFSGSGLLLGAIGSSLKVNITNAELQFLNGINKIAWISGEAMMIENANIQKKLIVGVHEIKKYNSTITTIKWVG